MKTIGFDHKRRSHDNVAIALLWRRRRVTQGDNSTSLGQRNHLENSFLEAIDFGYEMISRNDYQDSIGIVLKSTLGSHGY